MENLNPNKNKIEEKNENVLYSVRTVNSVETTDLLQPTSSDVRVPPFLSHFQTQSMTPTNSYSKKSRRHISISNTSYGASDPTPCKTSSPSSISSFFFPKPTREAPLETPVDLKPAPSKIVKIAIAGVPVEFPFEPYPVQKYMMNQVCKINNYRKYCICL